MTTSKTIPTHGSSTVYLFAVLFTWLMILSATPTSARAAGLTESQIQSVINLLVVFDVDQANVDIVRSILSNNSTTGYSTAPLPPSLNVSFTRNLFFGLKGNDVSLLQMFLKQQGYYAEEVTGYFGTATKIAVMEFQKVNDIAPLGGVGPVTQSKILSFSTTTFSSASADLSFVRNLYLDLKGEDVLQLQQFLIKQGFLSPTSATGYFGPLTEAGVKKFQIQNNIVYSGSVETTGFGAVGPQTKTAIQRIAKESDMFTKISDSKSSESLIVSSSGSRSSGRSSSSSGTSSNFDINVSSLGTSTIAGIVWDDADGDGRIDTSERKFSQRAVTLKNSSTNALLQTSMTTSSGQYSFSNVSAGSYRVSHAIPAGYERTLDDSTIVTVSTITTLNFGVRSELTLEETKLNAFGDRWGMATSNPSLPIMVGTGCYRYPSPGMTSAFTQAELEFFGRLKAPFYHEGCADILTVNPPYEEIAANVSAIKLRSRVEQFKTANPSSKFIGYAQLTEWASGVVGYADIYNNHRDWYVYKKGMSTSTLNNAVRERNGIGNFLLDVTNPAYQDYVASQFAEALDYLHMDGVMVDLVYSPPAVIVSQMPDETLAGWEDGWLALLTKLKTSLGSNKYVFSNVARENYSFASEILDIVDGVMLEDTFSTIADDVGDRVALVQPTITAAENKGKWILTTENTLVDGSSFAGTSVTVEKARQRYYLSAFYIFSNGNMLYYYNPPAAVLPQYGAQAFFSEWNLDIGAPTSAYTNPVSDVYTRNYERGIVYLNNSSLPYRVQFGACCSLLTPEGIRVENYTLPAKTGMLFVGGALVDQTGYKVEGP